MTDLATNQADLTPPPTLARLILLRELRRLVKESKRKPAELAVEMGMVPRTVDRWLKGDNQDIKPGQVMQLLTAIGFEARAEITRRLASLAQATKQRGMIQRLDWFAGYDFGNFLGLERDAHTIWTYESTLVPGLLQIQAYTEAFLRSAAPELTDAEVEERIAVRTRRQQVLSRAPRPADLFALIDEGVLSRWSADADPTTRRDQLDHLLAMSKRENVTIQIVPFSVGPHFAGSIGPFVAFGFDGVDGFEAVGPITYAETAANAMYGETEEQTRPFLSIRERLSRVAATPEKSAKMIAAARDAAGAGG